MLKNKQLSLIKYSLRSTFFLKEISFSMLKLEDKDIKHIIQFLKSNFSITSLDLSHNLLTDKGATQLQHFIEFDNQTLLSLDLKKNNINSEIIWLLINIKLENNLRKKKNYICWNIKKLTDTTIHEKKF